MTFKVKNKKRDALIMFDFSIIPCDGLDISKEEETIILIKSFEIMRKMLKRKIEKIRNAEQKESENLPNQSNSPIQTDQTDGKI